MESSSVSTTSKQFSTLLVSDNLKLDEIAIPDIPKDIIFPDDLNRFLREQIQYLTHENGMLQKNLTEVEKQFRQSSEKVGQLSTQIEDLRGSTHSKNSFVNVNGLSTVNIASTKIIELSKKLRERNSDVEVLKTKCSKLEAQIFELTKFKKTNLPLENSICEINKQEEKSLCELKDNKIKNLQERLHAANNKLCDVRNSNMQLKNDLKLANKILIQEVGENYEGIQNIIGNMSGSWRGRAQIICDLQQKNSELKEKLKTFQQTDKSGNLSSNSTLINDTRSAQIMKLEKQVDLLSKENSDMKAYLQDLKKKFDAAKARNKVLESENSSFKMKINDFNFQNDQNQDIIDCLTVKIAHAQDSETEAVQQKQAIIARIEKENKRLQIDMSKKQCKIENFESQIAELQRDVENYKERMKNKQLSISSISEIENSNKTLNQYKAERLRLLELTKITSERLENERMKHSETEARYMAERQRVAKLEAQIARIKLDQQSDRSSNYSLKFNKELDRSLEYKLQLNEEKVKSLETKLQVERSEHQMDLEEFKKILSERQFGT